MDKFDYSVFIGRFQPFHFGHFYILKKALEISKQVIVVIGSANQSPNIKNPWSDDNRKDMIINSLSDSDNDRTKIIFQEDHPYSDNSWLAEIKSKISKATNNSKNVALIGCKYDPSSFYLDLFPDFTFVSVDDNDNLIRATQIRDKFFGKHAPIDSYVPNGTMKVINKILDDTRYSPTKRSFYHLYEEYDYYKSYKESFESCPFGPIFVTVDIAVIAKNKILLVRRNNAAGRNLLALPGGFVNENETIKNAAIRELIEETNINVPIDSIKKAITPGKIFDSPNRSLRGRVITHLYTLTLNCIPEIKAGDDAGEVMWVDINKLYDIKSQLFEDHFWIAHSHEPITYALL